jgi:rfaE bifunctional protein kinase chain/domain/rfaE bifunctional protein nucleotidyltransferase chain/domain
VINKIVDLNSIELIINDQKRKAKKIVLCHGVFDLIHYGHILYFNSAKKFGDILVVSVTPSKFVNKGLGRPYYNDIQRLSFLSNLSIIDYVVLNTRHNALDVIQKIKPHIYCKGPDYKNIKKDLTGEIKKEIAEVKKYKGKVVTTKDISFSSSKIINDLGGTYNKEQALFIENLRKDFDKSEFDNLLKKIEKLKILVIGEIIIDKYIFSESVGKSGKEHHLVTRPINEKLYLGGTGSIANHISSFCQKVTVVSAIGNNRKHLKFIRNKLSKNISLNLIYKKDSPTIEKVRYLDKITNNKLLGVYNLNDDLLNHNQEIRFKKIIYKNIKKNNIIIVSDYGHGLISKKIAKLICNKSKFLSLNSQLNAFNIGHHSINKYRNINFLIINEGELRHELREKNLQVELLIKRISKDLNIDHLIVTRGKNGSVYFSKKNNSFFYCPAFASKVVDKVGAGDTMLSVMSFLIYIKFPIKIAMFLGSLAAAQSVETISNSLKLDKIRLIKYALHMLK